jgi:hypothetical protein
MGRAGGNAIRYCPRSPWGKCRVPHADNRYCRECRSRSDSGKCRIRSTRRRHPKHLRFRHRSNRRPPLVLRIRSPRRIRGSRTRKLPAARGRRCCRRSFAKALSQRTPSSNKRGCASCSRCPRCKRALSPSLPLLPCCRLCRPRCQHLRRQRCLLRDHPDLRSNHRRLPGLRPLQCGPRSPHSPYRPGQWPRRQNLPDFPPRRGYRRFRQRDRPVLRRFRPRSLPHRLRQLCSIQSRNQRRKRQPIRSPRTTEYA